MNAKTTHNAFQLAGMAGCSSPDDAFASPGARFLLQVEEAYNDAVAEEWYDDDESPHEIADNAVPVYTHERWQVFVDLCAYQEDVSELGETSDMTQNAGIALYMIAERLIRSLHVDQ